MMLGVAVPPESKTVNSRVPEPSQALFKKSTFIAVILGALLSAVLFKIISDLALG